MKKNEHKRCKIWEEICDKNVIRREINNIKNEKMKNKEHKRGKLIVEEVRHTWQRGWEECVILLREIWEGWNINFFEWLFRQFGSAWNTIKTVIRSRF